MSDSHVHTPRCKHAKGEELSIAEARAQLEAAAVSVVSVEEAA